MKQAFDFQKLPGKATYLLTIMRKDVSKNNASYQLEFNFENQVVNRE